MEQTELFIILVCWGGGRDYLLGCGGHTLAVPGGIYGGVGDYPLYFLTCQIHGASNLTVSCITLNKFSTFLFNLSIFDENVFHFSSLLYSP